MTTHYLEEIFKNIIKHVLFFCNPTYYSEHFSVNQRSWWVFTPTEIKGGLVYYPGGSVDARAYFPLAFEIAARGHLVVIVEMPLRSASYGYQDANTVISSKHPSLSGNPKP